MNDHITRRSWLKGSASLVAASAIPSPAVAQTQQQPAPSQAPVQSPQDASRARRMQWWNEARFGMFIHWGLYSVSGRHEWVMENEGIPVVEYAPVAKQFQPKP